MRTMYDELIKRFGTIQVEGWTHKIDATQEEIEAAIQQEKEKKAKEERRTKNEYFKREEIVDYWNDFIKEYDSESIKRDIDDLHNYAFNESYYIIGTYKATQYEQDNFGAITTDLSEPESVVNMYVYIVGEEIYQEWLSKQDED